MIDMYIFFICLAAITFSFGILSLILYFIRRNKPNIVYNKAGFWIIEICSLYFSSMLFIFTLLKEDLESLIIFSFISSISLFALIAWLNITITYNTDDFYVRNFFGLRRKYPYKDIICYRTKVKNHREIKETLVYFYTDRYRFSVSSTAENYSAFLNKVNHEYKKYNNGRKLPKKRFH